MAFARNLTLACAVFGASALVNLAVGQDEIGWKVGTKRTYVSTDMFNKVVDKWEERVTDRQGESFTVDYVSGSGTTQYSVQLNGEHSRPMPRGAGNFTYTPVKLPLKEGTEWEWTYHYIGGSMGVPAQVTRKCTAGKMEEIQVPAGKFAARKIDCKGAWMSTAGSNGTSFRTSWYAPSISAVVKYVEVSSYSGGRDQWTAVLDTLAIP